MQRRQFLARLTGSLLAIPAASALVGCALEDEPGQNPPGSWTPPGGGGGGLPPDPSVAVMNADNSGHLHSFELKCSHAVADGWTYTADGAHTHQVSLSAQDLDQIFAGGTVTITTNDGHPHTWVISLPNGMCT